MVPFVNDPATVALMAAFAVFLYIGLLFANKKLSDKISAIEPNLKLLQTGLKEKERQQQVIYNLSTSIFLMDDINQIIEGTISEVINMYKWPNITYIPKDDSQTPTMIYGCPIEDPKDKIFKLIDQDIETFSAEKDNKIANVGIFPVGQRGHLYGAIYVSRSQEPLTYDQLSFFKTIASFLTIAIGNSRSPKQKYG